MATWFSGSLRLTKTEFLRLVLLITFDNHGLRLKILSGASIKKFMNSPPLKVHKLINR